MKKGWGIPYAFGSAMLLLAGYTTGALAQEQLYAYPNAGQSATQQQKDQAECRSWAIGQSGFNPSSAPPPSAYVPPPPETGVFGRGQVGGGGLLRDAGKGAAGGAIGGAIAGDAGKGAAIGAVSGMFLGGIRRAGRAQEQQQWDQQQAMVLQQQQQQQAALQREYNRAFAACMHARKYVVE